MSSTDEQYKEAFVSPSIDVGKISLMFSNKFLNIMLQIVELSPLTQFLVNSL